MSMHYQAMKCADKCRLKLASADSDDLIYAALQARMAIEHLFYELVPLYKKELPLDVLRNWQPAHIIREVLDCDPDAEYDVVNLTMFDERSDGTLGPGIPLGGQTAVTRSLLRDHYHKLGKYLHAPEDQKPHNPAKIRSAVTATVDDLERFRHDQIIVNLSEKVELSCDYCGHTFSRQTRAFEISSQFQCRGLKRDKRCEALFEAKKEAEGWAIGHVKRAVDCPDCKITNYFPTHILTPNQTIICCSCQSSFVLHGCLQLVRISAESEKI